MKMGLIQMKEGRMNEEIFSFFHFPLSITMIIVAFDSW